MSFKLPGEANPFEAPRAGIGEDVLYRDFADNDAELIRREHIGREANIKSLGHLAYLFAFLAVFGTIILALLALGVIPSGGNQQNQLDPGMQKLLFGGMAVFYLLLTALYGALGYGLTGLQVWARWTVVAFMGLGLLGVAIYTVLLSILISPLAGLGVLLIGGGIYGGILYLLVSKKAGMVFSSEYKEIIRKTPHVKPTTSLLVKILLVLILLAIVVVVLAAIYNGSRG